jgi:hypothetical protein
MFWDNVLESFMLLCFAAAWPASIYKSWTCRTRKGKSLFFLLIILLGYLSGVLRVLRRNDGGFMLVPYTFNTVLVLVDTVLYYRNYRIDEEMRPLFGGAAGFFRGFLAPSPRRKKNRD